MKSKFTTGQSTKECMNCHKITRDTGRGERHTDFCWACMHAMELENEHSDDGHEEFDPECPTCQEESKIHTYIVDLKVIAKFLAEQKPVFHKNMIEYAYTTEINFWRSMVESYCFNLTPNKEVEFKILCDFYKKS